MNTGKRLFIEQLYHLYAEKLYNIAYVKLEYDEEKYGSDMILFKQKVENELQYDV